MTGTTTAVINSIIAVVTGVVGGMVIVTTIPKVIRGRSNRRPEPADFITEFLPGRRPIGLDRVSQFDGMAFDIQFVLFQPRDVQFLSWGPSTELAGDVFFVVPDDSIFPREEDVSGSFFTTK